MSVRRPRVRSLALTGLCALGLGVAGLSGAAAQGDAAGIDLADWATGLPARFFVSGQKTEPTYQLQTDLARDGDVFAVLGGAPAHSRRALVRVMLADDQVLALPCPEGAICGAAAGIGGQGAVGQGTVGQGTVGQGTGGHLATAALIAALRAGQLSGRVAPVPHGQHQVVCVPGEMLGIDRPILDPCFEITTGAAIAQRHRNSGMLEGPTLDPLSVVIHGPDAALPDGLDLALPRHLRLPVLSPGRPRATVPPARGDIATLHIGPPATFLPPHLDPSP